MKIRPNSLRLTLVFCYGGLTNKGLSLVLNRAFSPRVGLRPLIPTTTQSPKPLYAIASRETKTK